MIERRSLACATLLIAAFALLSSARTCRGQGVEWKTNFFNVTGSNVHQIRESIRTSRPFREPYDGFTAWNVSWRFSYSRNADGCRFNGVTTITTVTTYLPRWTMPTNAQPEVKEWWNRFFTRLADHEHGHAVIGLTAAAHVRKHLKELQPTASDCDALSRTLNSAAEKIVQDYRQREKDYDERTGHGSRPDARP